jgi:hypothetical protein
MADAGKNDYLQAILQPLMDNEAFVEYFLNQGYKTKTKDVITQPFCELMTELCKHYFQ